MATLKTLVNSAVPGGLNEESDPPTSEDNRMPKAAVDPFGLLYRPVDPETGEQAEELLYTVPDSNFSGEQLKDDPQLNPLKAGILAIEEKVDPTPPEEEIPVEDEGAGTFDAREEDDPGYLEDAEAEDEPTIREPEEDLLK